MLDFPLDNSSKGSIENAQFRQLKVLKLFGGLPIYTNPRSSNQKQGELYIADMGGTYRICVYIDGAEKTVNLS